MTDFQQCPECGGEIPPDAPAGVCPNCLMQQALGSEQRQSPSPLDPGNPYAKTTPTPPGLVPPLAEELAPLFPQLEILELIGHGGMGAVYKARQSKLDRLVALKIIRPESANDPAFAERFNREARTLARLSHPAIIAVHDFGEVQSRRHAPRDESPAHKETKGERNDQRHADGAHHAERDGDNERILYYFVMEYIDGVNLRQLMAEGKLPADQALAIVPQVCDALQFAHDDGIVHRDIKPENILVDQRGRVKIADFGLAKLASRSDHDFTLTGTYQVMGTPRYMAPEQMEHSHAVDHRADIYSLGVVFYEMLTGQVPAGHFDPPSKQTPIDARLDEVVLRALARDPERRYQQASEISSHVNAIRGVTGDVYSTPAAQSSRGAFGEYPPGPSTIVERAFFQIIGGVRDGKVQRSLASPATVGIAAILMCFTGVITLFIPWAIDRGGGGEIYAYDNSWGLLAGTLFFALGLTLFAGSPADRRPKWRPWTLMFSGAVLLGLVLLFRGNVMKLSVVPDGSFFATFGLSIGLLLIGAWDLRCLLSRPIDPDSADTPASDPVDEYPSGIGGRDWVTLTKEQVEADDLPDVCIVCGRPTQERLNKNFSYQSEWSQLLTVIGIFCGILPGIIIAQLTEREQRIACPVCPRHRNHWSKLVWWASTAWLIPVVLAVVGGLIGWGLGSTDVIAPITAVAAMTVGLIVYLVPLVRMGTTRVDAEEITDRTVRLRRVSAAFAREAGGVGRTPPDEEAEGPDNSNASEEPRFSRKALVGACLGLLTMLALVLFAAAVVFATSGTSIPGFLLVYPFFLFVIPGLIAGTAATILGWLAINDIRQSEGRLTGLPLAVADTLAFPLLLINGVMFGLFLYFFYAGIEMNVAMSVFLAAGQTAMIGGWLSSDIVHRVWRAVTPVNESGGNGDAPSPASESPIPDSARPAQSAIATMDRSDRDDTQPDSPRISGTAIAGLVLFLMSLFPSVPLALVWSESGVDWINWPWPWLCISIGGIVMTAFGFSAISEIRGSNGRLRGLGLAFVDAALFPILLVNGLIIAGVAVVTQVFVPPMAGPVLAVVVSLALVADWFVLRAAWRATGRRVDESVAEEQGPSVRREEPVNANV